jgi:glyoxylase-like metal-dependent hydrolase (beta-lactamase superfamily II)
MKRIVVLTTLLAVGALSLAVATAEQPANTAEQPANTAQQPANTAQQPAAGAQAAAKVVGVEKLRDNLFVLTGGGGNTAVFVGASGVVLVDTKLPGWGQPILDKLKELTPKPVTTIINTHTHGDHVSGNVEFPATVEVVVHENTAANMQEMRASTQTAPDGQPPNIFKMNDGRGMPKQTFKDRMTIGAGADRIDLYYFGRGHTNGDTWVVFPALRTVHAGDIFSTKGIPGLDAVNGGSGLAIADSLTKAADTLTNVDTIITGHSRTMTVTDLREYAQFNRDFANDVRAGKAAGRSAEQVASAWKIPATYVGYATPNPVRLLQNVQVVFDELK